MRKNKLFNHRKIRCGLGILLSMGLAFSSLSVPALGEEDGIISFDELEEEVQGGVQESAEASGSSVLDVPFSESGDYTVSFTQADLLTLKDVGRDFEEDFMDDGDWVEYDPYEDIVAEDDSFWDDEEDEDYLDEEEYDDDSPFIEEVDGEEDGVLDAIPAEDEEDGESGEQEQTSAELVLTLVREEDGVTPLSGASFDLYRVLTEEGYEEVIVNSGQLITDQDGQIRVEDLEEGVYFFEETAAPEGCLLPEDPRTEVCEIAAGMTGEVELVLSNAAAVSPEEEAPAEEAPEEEAPAEEAPEEEAPAEEAPEEEAPAEEAPAEEVPEEEAPAEAPEEEAPAEEAPAEEAPAEEAPEEEAPAEEAPAEEAPAEEAPEEEAPAEEAPEEEAPEEEAPAEEAPAEEAPAEEAPAEEAPEEEVPAEEPEAAEDVQAQAIESESVEAASVEAEDTQPEYSEIESEAAAQETAAEEAAAEEAAAEEAAAEETEAEGTAAEETEAEEAAAEETEAEEAAAEETEAEETAAEETEAEETAVEEAAEETEAEDESIEADETESELPEETETEYTASLAGLTQEDVRVAFDVVAAESKSTHKIRYQEKTAQITAFANEGGVITVSFHDPDAAAYRTQGYRIEIERLGLYAPVTAYFESDAQGDKVDDEIPEEADYTPDFDNGDIRVPEGTTLVEDGLIVNADAPASVAAGLEDSLALAGEMSRAGRTAEDFPTAVNQIKTNTVEFVNGDAKKVYNYGKSVYDIFKATSSGDYKEVFSKAKGFLKLCGLIKGGGGGVSNEDLLKEIQALREDVRQLHALASLMSQDLEETLKQTYKIGLQVFDNAVITMEANSDILFDMFQLAYQLAEETGEDIPGEDASAEEEQAFAKKITRLMKQEASDFNDDFEGVQTVAQDLRVAFTQVAGELAKEPDLNPLGTYDSYVGTYFNFDSQGKYMRQAYRSDIEYKLKRAYSLLEVYFNLSGNLNSPYKSLTAQMQDALKQMDEMPADSGNRTYSPTFGKYISGICASYSSEGNSFSDAVINRFVQRCGDRDLEEEMKLAGLWVRDRWVYQYVPRLDGGFIAAGDRGAPDHYVHGLGLNSKRDGKHYKADIIHWDKKVYKQVTTYNGASSFKPFDKDEIQEDNKSIEYLNYIWLEFSDAPK